MSRRLWKHPASVVFLGDNKIVGDNEIVGPPLHGGWVG